MARRYMECRDLPSTVQCSLRISGEEDEVLQAAVQHAVSVHHEQDTPELRQTIRSHLKNE